MNKFFGIKRLALYSITVAVFFCGCSEFIEPSLETKNINLVAPSKDAETTSYQLTFFWETIPDAISYRLQIVSPSFNKIEKLLLDTVVRNDKFTFTLEPGKYEWRVRAENGSSQTPYTTSNFTIHLSSLTDQIVQMVSPANLFITSKQDINFEWLTLYGATKYRIQIDKNNFANENNLVVNQEVSGNKFLAQLSSEGTYQFRVRAENQTQSSKWSTVRSLIYDQTPPAKVVLSSPTNQQLVSSPVALSWSAIADAEKYELFVYRSDSTTLANSSFPTVLHVNSLSFTLGTSQETYVWRARAIDKAGNKGELSNFYSFTLQ